MVADEVRKLAGRSSDAANDIQKLIEDSQTKVNNGTSLVRNAGSTMKDIVDHITRVTDVLEEINAATSEQSDGIKQVNIAVAELDRMTQENAAMVEESTTAAEQLKEQADRLTGTISSFKLSNAASPALQAPQDAYRARQRPSKRLVCHSSMAAAALALAAMSCVNHESLFYWFKDGTRYALSPLADEQHCLPNQSAGTQRLSRSSAGWRTRARLCRGGR